MGGGHRWSHDSGQGVAFSILLHPAELFSKYWHCAKHFIFIILFNPYKCCYYTQYRNEKNGYQLNSIAQVAQLRSRGEIIKHKSNSIAHTHDHFDILHSISIHYTDNQHHPSLFLKSMLRIIFFLPKCSEQNKESPQAHQPK